MGDRTTVPKSVCRLLPVAALAVLMVIVLCPVGAQADIANEAEARATYGSTSITSDGSSASVPLSPASPALSATLSGSLADDGRQPRAGDIIDWVATIENVGDATVTGIAVSGEAVDFVCGSVDAPLASLPPGQTLECVGRQVLLQSDLDSNGGGDGDIDETVAVTSDNANQREASASVAVSTTPALSLSKRVVATRQLFAGVHEIEYLLTAENIGTVRLTGLEIDDDLGGLGTLQGHAEVTRLLADGFMGSSEVNPDYDGTSDTRLLGSGNELAPGQRGEVRLVVRLAVEPGSFRIENRASANAAELAAPVGSVDPAGSGEMTVLAIADSDGDGVIDVLETGDRDGDGIADAADFDPSGFFYCETDGRILPGGRIAVDNLTTGASQDGVGSHGGITILRDGADGSYQFQVSEAGRYRLRYALPPQGIASIARRPGRAIDLTALSRRNPVVFGSGQRADTEVLVDISAEGNPYHLEFLIGAGDPVFINNNIPLRYCARPELSAEAEIIAGPVLQGDGRSRVTYRLTATNSGSERVDEVQIRDDLAAAFGESFQVLSKTLVSAPPQFGGSVNPFFDGRSNRTLLTSGGNLGPGEAVAVELTVLVGVTAGTYSNAVTVTGLSPLDASNIVSAPSEAVAAFAVGSDQFSLLVEASADPELAGPGQRIGFSFSIANQAETDREDLQLVVQMPSDLIFLDGSAAIDTAQSVPLKRGNELVWSGVSVGREHAVTLRFDAAMAAVVRATEFKVYGFARDADENTVVSDVAAAVVLRDREAVFDCVEITGQVFDDRNRDGFVQQGEPGIPGVALEGPGGLRVETDVDGRFVIPCPLISEVRPGTSFSLQVDPASLPQGFWLTTPAVRDIELSRGKVARLAFGAANQRIVTHILDDDSFVGGSTRLQPGSLRALANLLNLLEEELSVLRLTYVANGNDAFAGRRIAAARDLVTQAWRAKERPYGLSIETRVVR